MPLQDYFRKALVKILYIFDQNQINQPLFLDKFFIILYFFQPFSYFFKFIAAEEENSRNFQTISHVFFFSNFSNFITFLENPLFSHFVYILCNFLIFLPFLIFAGFFIVFHLKFEEKSNKNPFFQAFCARFLFYFLYIHHWVFLLPFSDILLQVFLKDQERPVFLPKEIPLIYYIFSLLSLTFNIILAFFGLWIKQSVQFLDISSMNLSSNSINYLIITIRLLFAILYPLYEKTEVFYLVLLHFWLILLSYRFSSVFPLRNRVLCCFYAEILFMCEAIAINITFYRYFEIITQENLVFITILQGVLGFKFGEKFFEFLYSKKVFYLNSQRTLYFLEEIFFLSENTEIFHNEFMLLGLLKSHTRRCSEVTCVFINKNVIKKNLTIEKQVKVVNKLISSKFAKIILTKEKNLMKTRFFIIKFMSYLTIANVNPVKSFYEIQKIINSAKIHEFGVFYEIILEILRKKIKAKIKTFNQNFRGFSNEENQISPEDFFKIAKIQNFYEKNLVDLVAKKKFFWENYEKGVNSTEELIDLCTTLTKELDRFNLELQHKNTFSAKNTAFYLLNIKYFSIFHSILYNSINLAIKFEDEFETTVLKSNPHQPPSLAINPLKPTSIPINPRQPNSIPADPQRIQNSQNLEKKFEIKLEDKFKTTVIKANDPAQLPLHSINPLQPTSFPVNPPHHTSIPFNPQRFQSSKNLENRSFLDPEIITFLISYLKFEGNIKEDYKSEKAARFFGYSELEFRTIKTLNPLMPLYIGQFHNRFLSNFFRKSKKSLKNSKNYIESFAVNKKEFVFPIKVFYGYNFDYKEDFVMMAAIMKINDEGAYNWLCEEHGNSIGFSENFFEFLKENYEFLSKNDVNLLNIFALIPEIKCILENCSEEKNGFSVMNRSGTLFLPDKMKEILQLISVVNKDDVEFKARSETTFFSKSYKTVRSNRTNRTENHTENTQTFKIPKLFISSLYNKEKLYEGCENSHEVKKRIFENFLIGNSLKKFYIIFDLNLQKHRYGSDRDDYIMIIQIKIKRLDKQQSFYHKTMESEYNRKRMESSRVELESSRVESNVSKGINNIYPQENKAKFPNIFGKTLKSRDNLEEKQGVEEEKEENSMKIISQNFDENQENYQASLNNSKEQEDILAEINRKSQHSSSVIGKKTTYVIFNSIHTIQRTSPKSLKYLSFALIFELFMIVVFFSVLYTLYKNYVSGSYEPIQKSMINYCRLATTLSYSTAMFTELEYQSFNLTTRSLNPLKKRLWDKIMKDNYMIMKEINFAERNMKGDVKYQRIYKEVHNFFIDYETLQMKTWKYADNVDFFTDLIFKTIGEFNGSLPKTHQIILQRNYPYFLPSTSVILLAVQADFNDSNLGTTDTALYVMVIFLVCSVFVKFFETFHLLKFHSNITQIMNIFRRVNLQDSINEKNFFQEILMILKQPFLRFSFIEKSTNKKIFSFEEQGGNTSKSGEVSRKKNAKNGQKFSFYNVKPLPITKILVFMTILFTWCVVYYFFNYYFWISNNQNINNLIQINIFFINVYIYSTSIVGFNTIALRERVVRNPEYEAINDSYQQHFVRMDYCYTNLVKRLYLIGNITATSLPLYTLDAKQNINSKDFDQLVYDDICELLYRQHFLEENELEFCQNSFHGGFKKGIFSLVNQFIQEIKGFQEYTQVFKEDKDKEKLEEQYKKVKEFVDSQEYEDFMFSYYYYHHTLLIYYDYINDYYKTLMDKEMEKLYLFLIATSIISGVCMLGLSIWMKKKLKSYYKYVTLSLSLIPIDKVINDEQTKCLINNFLKKM